MSMLYNAVVAVLFIV